MLLVMQHPPHIPSLYSQMYFSLYFVTHNPQLELPLTSHQTLTNPNLSSVLLPSTKSIVLFIPFQFHQVVSAQL